MHPEAEDFVFTISITAEMNNRLTDIGSVRSMIEGRFGLAYTSASNDLLEYSPHVDLAIKTYKRCNKKRCELGLKASDGRSSINFSNTGALNSCTIQLANVSNLNKGTLREVVASLKDIYREGIVKSIRAYEGVSSNKFLDQCSEAKIIGPSVNLGINGAEWYVYISPDLWKPEYSEGVFLDAPIGPALDQSGYVEWFLYEDPNNFDHKAAKRHVKYLGHHRKRKPFIRGPENDA